MVTSNWKSIAHRAFGAIGHMAPTLAPTPLSRFLRVLVGHLQALVTPQAPHPLVVDLPAGPAQLLGGASPSPPGSTLGEGPQELPQLGLVIRRCRRVEALGGAVLADHPARSSFGDPEPVPQHPHGCALAVRGQKFPSASSLSIDLSSSASARSFFSRAFSRLELLEPLGVVGLHAAVLGEPAMPGRLGDLELAAHLLEVHAAGEELLALGELADDLIRRVPSSSHHWVLSCLRHDDGGDRTAQLLDHYEGLTPTRQGVNPSSTGSSVEPPVNPDRNNSFHPSTTGYAYAAQRLASSIGG